MVRWRRLRASDRQHRSEVVIAEIQGIDRLWYNIIGPTAQLLNHEPFEKASIPLLQ